MANPPALKHILEDDVEIKASAKQFHDFFCERPHNMHHIGTHIKGCELIEGEFGKVGSIICWTYFHDGKLRKAKEVIDAIDLEKNSITLRVIEGDLMEVYKSYVITISATPKEDGSQGSIVHYHLDYELKHEEIDHPETLLQYFREISAYIDAALVSGF